MRALDILRLSLRNALRGRTRTALTVAATAVGVFCTILVLALGVCARRTVAGELEALGISGASIYPKKVASDAGLRLSVEDAEAVAQAEGVDSALAVVIKYGSYSIKNWQGNAVVFGTSAGLGDALDVELLYGRLPNATDVRACAGVAVVDAEFAKTVYGRENIVGKTISLTAGGTRELEIIGVIRSQSAGVEALLGQSLPSFFYVPISTLSELNGTSGVDQILVTGESSEEAAVAAISLLERNYRAPNTLKYENISGLREQIDDVMVAVSVFIAAIGGISVLVAGLGIMNTMLSTAIERRREVGIYMSLGAKSRDIILQFVAEAGIISVLGALFGAVVAIAALEAATRLSGFDLRLGGGYVAAAVAVATAVGALFGVAPAVRASKTDPIEALRER